MKGPSLLTWFLHSLPLLTFLQCYKELWTVFLSLIFDMIGFARYILKHRDFTFGMTLSDIILQFFFFFFFSKSYSQIFRIFFEHFCVQNFKNIFSKFYFLI